MTNEKKFSELKDHEVEFIYNFICRVESIHESFTGPILLTLFDGSALIQAKVFDNKARFLESINPSDILNIKARYEKRSNKNYLNILNFTKLVDNEKKIAETEIELFLSERSTVNKDHEFLIKHEVLDKLKENMLNAAYEIRRAIFEGAPIIVRHHADADGYIGAFALNKAILPLIEEVHEKDRPHWLYYKRLPSRAPFYEYYDVIKDLSLLFSEQDKVGQKDPLIILIDNGSTSADLTAIKKARIYNTKIVVIDHHEPNGIECKETDNFCNCHVNPYLVGFDYNITAGMLATEVARIVNPKVKNLDHYPAVSAIADHSTDKAFDKYLALAENANYDLETLKKISDAINFEAYYLRFNEAQEIILDIIEQKSKTQKKIIKLINDEVEYLKEHQLEVVKNFIKTKDTKNKIQIATIDLEKCVPTKSYPTPGKTTGLAHNYIAKDSENKKIITIGLTKESIIIRASRSIIDMGFSVTVLLNKLQNDIPYGYINGGGHNVAGTIRFVQAVKEEVIKKTEEFIEKLK